MEKPTKTDIFWITPQNYDCEEILHILIKHFQSAPCLAALLTPLPQTLDDQDCEKSWPTEYRNFHWLFGVSLHRDDIDPEPSCLGDKFTFESFETMISEKPGFRMGYFAYEMGQPDKNLFSALEPAHTNPKSAFWFQPSLLIKCHDNRLEFIIDKNSYQNSIINLILDKKPILHSKHKIKDKNKKQKINKTSNYFGTTTKIPWKFKSKNLYLKDIETIKNEIIKGNLYELNLCLERELLEYPINCIESWQAMTKHTKAPFSAFIKHESTYIMCLSPERFLKKQNQTLLSQPIKGTAKRTKESEKMPVLIQSLINDTKEKAEHIMIVDLIRNDLSRCSEAKSVKVKELQKIVTFPNIVQIISSIESQTISGIGEILNSCFPMGSMTGAPKTIVRENIAKLENKKRGIFSGCIGYIDQEQNFDFNVVIRTLIYDASTHKSSLSTGSAITIDSIPNNEWEECKRKVNFLKIKKAP